MITFTNINRSTYKHALKSLGMSYGDTLVSGLILNYSFILYCSLFKISFYFKVFNRFQKGGPWFDLSVYFEHDYLAFGETYFDGFGDII